MTPVKSYGQKMAKRLDKLTAACLKRIEGLRIQHGAPGAPMRQKTLARRAQQSYARVHRFLSGQMPYPPMDFLDAIFRSFGTTLADELKGVSTPPVQLPVLRADVQEVANLLDDVDPAIVEQVKGWISLFSKTKASGEASRETDRAPATGRGAEADATRGGRAAKRRT